MPRAAAPTTRGNGTRKRAPLPRGRHSLLTEEVEKKICDAVRAGVYLSTAAQYAGVGYSTLMLWMQKGRECTTRKGKDARYREFLEKVEEAAAQSEVAAQLQWRAAWSKDWKSAERWLQSRFPDRYGPDRDPNAPIAMAGVNLNIQLPNGTQPAQSAPESSNVPLEALIEANPRLLSASQALFDEIDAMYGQSDADQSVIEPSAYVSKAPDPQTDEFGVIEGVFEPIDD